MAGLPLDANVPFITVMATQMPLYGRGRGATGAAGQIGSLNRFERRTHERK